MIGTIEATLGAVTPEALARFSVSGAASISADSTAALGLPRAARISAVLPVMSVRRGSAPHFNSARAIRARGLRRAATISGVSP